MLIAQYFVEFIFYSFLGWIWESIYCTSKQHRWQDRGFLFGPICPIYGFCVVGASILFRYVPGTSDPDLPLWAVFLICVVGSAVAELSTSIVLEKRFHARWWDYSDLPLNFHGRICLPVSLCFGAAGVAIVKYLLPLVADAHQVLPGLAYEGIALGFAILFGADYALTKASLTALLSDIESVHREFNDRAEETYERIQQAPELISESIGEKKAEIRESAAERRERLEEHRNEIGQSIQEHIEERRDVSEQSRKLQSIAARHAKELPSGQRRALRNIVSFHYDESRRLEGRTAGDHLKEALKKLEEKKAE
ncbi:MAG: hypothetical protein SOV71_00670 [Anaerovoracaceae bacterium]|nr:hypothetical protein [Bacillota bacterium]MDY2670059.1 hypothetical protein [Anaerovoracaceae bacterium]